MVPSGFEMFETSRGKKNPSGAQAVLQYFNKDFQGQAGKQLLPIFYVQAEAENQTLM